MWGKPTANPFLLDPQKLETPQNQRQSKSPGNDIFLLLQKMLDTVGNPWGQRNMYIYIYTYPTILLVHPEAKIMFSIIMLHNSFRKFSS